MILLRFRRTGSIAASRLSTAFSHSESCVDKFDSNCLGLSDAKAFWRVAFPSRLFSRRSCRPEPPLYKGTRSSSCHSTKSQVSPSCRASLARFATVSSTRLVSCANFHNVCPTVHASCAIDALLPAIVRALIGSMSIWCCGRAISRPRRNCWAYEKTCR